LILATGCIRKVDESDSNYTEIENFSDLGVIAEGDESPAAAEATGAAVKEVEAAPAQPAAERRHRRL